MQRGNGAVIGKQNTPTTSVATGVWALNEVQRAVLGGNWPASTIVDPYFENVSLLLHGNGTNGAQNNTFLDSSTNNFTITRNGNTTQGTFTPYGSNWSNYFDGSDDLNAPSNAAFTYGTSDFTIEGWFFITGRSGPNSYEYLFAQGSSSGTSSLGLYREGGVLKVWNGSTVITGTTTLALNTWNHIALSRSGTTMRLFLNGVQEGSATNSNSISTGSSYGISIGRWTEIDTNYIVGYVSNFRVVKGTAVYTSAFTPPTASLTAITNTSLLTCADNRFIDDSTNNFTITRNGDVSVQRFSPFNPTTPYAAGTIGGSGYFDGTNDFINTADNAAFDFGSGNMTIECWAYYMGAAGTASGLFGKAGTGFRSVKVEGSTNSGWTIYCSTNGSSWTNNISIAGSSFTPNAWTHFALVRNGATLTAYINGQSAGTTNLSTSVIFDGSDDFVIGATATDTAWQFFYDWNGYISDFRVIKGTAVYTSTFTPPTAPLTAITNTSLLTNFTNAGIIDNAEMNNLETVGNAQISTAQSKFGGGSLYFDGSGDFVQTFDANPNLQFGTGDFTVEGWVYFNTSGQHGILQISSNPGGFNTSNTNSIAVQRSATGQWEIYAKNSAPQGNATINQNQWYHFAVVRSGTTTTFYVNGVSTITVTSDSTNYTGSYIGLGAIYSTAVPLNGYIDDLRITKGYARYTANFTAPTLPFPDQ